MTSFSLVFLALGIRLLVQMVDVPGIRALATGLVVLVLVVVGVFWFLRRRAFERMMNAAPISRWRQLPRYSFEEVGYLWRGLAPPEEPVASHPWDVRRVLRQLEKARASGELAGVTLRMEPSGKVIGYEISHDGLVQWAEARRQRPAFLFG